MSWVSLLKLSFRKKLPVVFQTERTECGHACVIMIAAWFGYHIDLTSMRKQCPTSPRGVSLWDIIGICEKLHLNARALRLEPETLHSLQCPAILHWDMNHFVVLKTVKKKHVIVHDPATGEKKYSYAELGRHFTGIALEVFPGNDFKKLDNKRELTLKGIIGSMSGWKKQLSIIFGMSFAIELGAIGTAVFTQLVLDKALPSENVSLLYLLGFAFFVIAITKVATEALRNWTVLYVMTTLNMQISSNLMKHLINLPLAFFEQRSAGDILSRFYAADEIQEKITTDFVQVLVDGVMAVVTLVVMLVYSIPLTAIALGFVAMALLARLLTHAPLKKHAQEQVAFEAREQSHILESLRAILPLTVFRKQPLRMAQWQTAHADSLNASIAYNKVRILFTAANQILFLAGHIALLLSGAFLVIDQQLSMGMMIAYLSFATHFHGKVQNLLEKLIDYKMLAVQLSRLSDIVFHKRSTEVAPSGRLVDQEIRGHLSFKNIAFRHDHNGRFLFRQLSMDFQPGQSTVITAPSGFGKTSLIKVLMQLLPAEEGEVFLDGRPVASYGTQAFCSVCAAVMQDDQLLSGSLLDNICFFDEYPDRGKAEESAKLACIHDDIQAMTMGYQTLVGEMGSHLSGGQRQRVLIARALYKRPKILFMDEGTSHLDEITERQINSNIKGLGITCIMVSHRQTVIAAADRVIDLQQASCHAGAGSGPEPGSG